MSKFSFTAHAHSCLVKEWKKKINNNYNWRKKKNSLANIIRSCLEVNLDIENEATEWHCCNNFLFVMKSRWVKVHYSSISSHHYSLIILFIREWFPLFACSRQKTFILVHLQMKFPWIIFIIMNRMMRLPKWSTLW
jgi:hypothetical protein